MATVSFAEFEHSFRIPGMDERKGHIKIGMNASVRNHCQFRK